MQGRHNLWYIFFERANQHFLTHLQIALLWPYVHKEVVIGKHGKEADDPVQLPKQVSTANQMCPLAFQF